MKVARLQSPTPPRPPALSAPLVVAAVYSDATLRAAKALSARAAAPDLLELRVDGFARQPGKLDALAARPPRPLIVTVRHPAEGGLDASLDYTARRRALYERFLPAATYIDMEVRSLRALAAVTKIAQTQGCRVIASFHDFQGMPTLARLRALAARAADAGADVFKVAATVDTPGALARLLDLLDVEDRLPLAVMGMGRLGRASRLVLAAAGSVLNYGYLGKTSQVPGQWPAETLRARIDEL